MKRTIIAIVLALGLLLLMAPTAVSAAGVTVVDRTGDGEWTDDTWQVEIYPGKVKATTLTLYNSSNSSLEVEVTVIPNSFDNGNLTFELDKANFTMPGRSYTDVTLSVTASGSATPGSYTAELEIKSELPPTPPPPIPPEPDIEEPEEEEPEEPVVEEPAPEEPIEPEEPEEEEPDVVEPEEEEPEVVEPEEEEPYMPPEKPKPGTPWGLIGGLAGGLAAAGGIGYWLWRRRRKEENYGNNQG